MLAIAAARQARALLFLFLSKLTISPELAFRLFF
jgi:hypothetical protein